MGIGLLEMNNKGYRVVHVNIPAKHIFGMVGRCGGGHNSVWTDWTKEGRTKRSKIIAEFEAGLDEICGHYKRLEKSILAEGFRNPITITCGPPKKRSWDCVPPEMHKTNPKKLLFLETTVGGSRLWIAQKHNMTVPCLVNDWTGRYQTHKELTDVEEIKKLYADPPKKLNFDDRLGLIEQFDTQKVGHHLGSEWSEDKLVVQRAPLWVGIMNKYGYRVEGLPKFVNQILLDAGIDQSKLAK